MRPRVPPARDKGVLILILALTLEDENENVRSLHPA